MNIYFNNKMNINKIIILIGSYLPKLNSIKCSGNRITEKSAISLLSKLDHNLKELDISKNRIVFKGSEKLNAALY